MAVEKMTIQLPETCWVKTDLETNIIAASPSWYKLWGYSEAEALGQSTRILNGHGPDAAKGKELMAELLQRGKATGRCVNTAKTGVTFSHDLE